MPSNASIAVALIPEREGFEPAFADLTGRRRGSAPSFGLARNGEFIEPDQADLPDGQISELAVQPLLQKYFTSPVGQIISTHSRHPVPLRGAYRDRHGRGVGCGGRGSVLRATGSQGGFRPVSDQQRADEGCCSVRRSRVVLTPQLVGVKFAELRRPNRA